jgi:hypothetical protein
VSGVEDVAPSIASVMGSEEKAQARVLVSTGVNDLYGDLNARSYILYVYSTHRLASEYDVLRTVGKFARVGSSGCFADTADWCACLQGPVPAEGNACGCKHKTISRIVGDQNWTSLASLSE